MSRILVVDDSSIMRRNITTILKKAGHEIVAEAPNGYIAYMEYKKYKPDLVTMDITMPIMNGIDSVKKIIQDFPDAVIIMISGDDQKHKIISAIQSGAKYYILKPFAAEKVVKIINDILKITNKANEEFPNTDMNGAISKINNAISDINNTVNKLRE